MTDSPQRNEGLDEEYDIHGSSGMTQLASGKRKRFAGDRISRLEDELEASPLEASTWIALADELKARDSLTELRETYEKMLKYFPTSAEMWISYITMEVDHSEFQNAEQLFSRCLTEVLKVNLWEVYLRYIRRANAEKDSAQDARETIQSAYEFALEHIGNDIDSEKIWLDYLTFLQSLPKGESHEQQQLMDLTRKTYRRALCIPLRNIETIWQGYNNFEKGLNKNTARKFIADRSATYMSARSAARELQNIIQDLDRSTLPSPRTGSLNEASQSEIWANWIQWELKNPLEASEDIVQQRVLYAYRQALMTLRFFPDWWFKAANFCHKKLGNIDEAIKLLNEGTAANADSFLLCLKSADVYGAQHQTKELKECFHNLLNTLKDKRAKLVGSEKDRSVSDEQTPENTIEASAQTAPEVAVLNRYITYAYTELLKAIKRVDGIKEARKVFSEARKLDYCTFHMYVASAMMEYYNSRESGIASKIFEIGLKRYSIDAEYIKEYFDFLILIDDEPNARALFEKSVVKMPPDQQKLLFAHYLKFENKYGDFPAISKLEERYSEQFPDEPAINLFVSRFDESEPSGFLNPIREIDLFQRLDASNISRALGELDDDSRRKKFRGDASPPSDLPDSIYGLLDDLPPASDYDTVVFSHKKLISLIQCVDIPQ